MVIYILIIIIFYSSSFGELDKMEYQRIHLKGRFIYKDQFAIRMRGRFDKNLSHTPQGLLGNSESSSHGGHIITPMRLDGSKYF